jgi:predicted nucleotidyltransferase
MVNILEEIKKFEREQGIKIIFAAESGARCWGLDSPTSDYDVRFIFHYPVREYLKIDRPKDTLERKNVEYNIDFVGYDIYKYLYLISKTNVNMLEMLNSSTVYYEGKSELMKVIREYANFTFNPVVAYYHYHALGWNNYDKYIVRGLEKGKNIPKTYVYALRGLLGALHALEHGELCPVNFEKFVRDTPLLPEEIKTVFLEEFIPMKRGKLVSTTERNSLVDTYLEMEFLKRKELNKEAKRERIKKKELPEIVDEILFDTLMKDLFGD